MAEWSLEFQNYGLKKWLQYLSIENSEQFHHNSYKGTILRFGIPIYAPALFENIRAQSQDITSLHSGCA